MLIRFPVFMIMFYETKNFNPLVFFYDFRIGTDWRTVAA